MEKNVLSSAGGKKGHPPSQQKFLIFIGIVFVLVVFTIALTVPLVLEYHDDSDPQPSSHNVSAKARNATASDVATVAADRSTVATQARVTDTRECQDSVRHMLIVTFC